MNPVYQKMWIQFTFLFWSLLSEIPYHNTSLRTTYLPRIRLMPIRKSPSCCASSWGMCASPGRSVEWIDSQVCVRSKRRVCWSAQMFVNGGHVTRAPCKWRRTRPLLVNNVTRASNGNKTTKTRERNNVWRFISINISFNNHKPLLLLLPK